MILDEPPLHLILEGILLASDKPLTAEQLTQLFPQDERPEDNAITEALGKIADACAERGFELKQVASGYRFQVRQELAPWVSRLWEEKPQRYTRAMLETLALIAYRQPITRGEIEDVRGVSVSSTIIRTLQEREWIRVVGHRDVPGRPAMFATTRQFLDYFNLENLNELPPLSEIRDLEETAKALNEQSDLLENIEATPPLTVTLEGDTSEEVSAEELFAELDEMEAELPDNFDDLIKKQKIETLATGDIPAHNEPVTIVPENEDQEPTQASGHTQDEDHTDNNTRPSEQGDNNADDTGHH
ncbi:SMC-Scp complex subunit ScpB [Candidatus Sororendozoicomonas aggregata]|uniref:SMC-Scp complex subunit ScpB n=1 Tax=Candidatus Sororendozoicomonas aggregata TaxID=3073239 RepID=UPI002ED20845